MRLRFLGFVVLACLGASACAFNPGPAGSPGTATPGEGVVEVAAEGARFTIGPLPAGWKRLKLTTNAAKVAYQHAVNHQAIMVNVIYAPNRAAGLRALRNHLLFDITSRTILEEQFLEVDNREALWSTVDGRLDGARIKMALLVVRIDDWVYDLVYVAVPETFDLNLEEFKQFIKTFHHQRRYPVE
jgi:hypothetical protein